MYERDYHATVLQDEKQSKNKQKKDFPWKTVLLVFVCVVLVGGFITVTKLSALQLQTVEVSGAQSADPKDVSQYVFARLTGKWLYIFPKTSLVLLPDRSLEKSIKRAFPRFETVAVSRSGTTTITVNVTEYTSVYLWCDELTTECSFMDVHGVVFAPAPFFSGSAYIKIFSGATQGYPFIPITEQQLATVQFTVERLKAITIDATEFHFYSNPNKIVGVFYHNGSPAEIIFDPEISTDTVLQSFFTALRTPPFSTRFKSDTATLQYIDLRLPNKIVYKFK